MLKENSKIDWEEIMNKFSSYKGSINEFCKENNIKNTSYIIVGRTWLVTLIQRFML